MTKAQQQAYDDMKTAWWAIWPIVIEDLNRPLLRNKPDEFWEHAKRLRNVLDDLIDRDSEVVPAIGVGFPMTHVTTTGKKQQEGADGRPGPRSATREAVRGPKVCQNCGDWQVGGPGMFACHCESSPHWMKTTGAGWTCEKHTREGE